MMDVGSGEPDAHARTFSFDLAFALILVTYGDRGHLVGRAVRQALLHPSARSVIVVDNNSSYSVQSVFLDTIDSDRIHVLRQKTNTGSAGGYEVGLQFAKSLLGIDYIILLDDDLLIEEATVDALLHYINENPNCDAVIVPRDDRPDQAASLQAGLAPAVKSNSFHDFHILDWQRLLQRRKLDDSRSQSGASAVPIEYAPYAGMVLSSALVRRAELPDRDFYVYCDDYEYLMKLKLAGARPILIDVPPLKSIDQSWNQKSGRAPAVFNTAAPAFRVYYSLRNRVAYERRYFVDNHFMYIINMAAFLAVGSLVSLSESGVQARRLCLLVTAIRDGWRGKLGRNDETVRRYS